MDYLASDSKAVKPGLLLSHKFPRWRTRGNIIEMSATGPCATILSERAALALVVAGAVDEVVLVGELDDSEGSIELRVESAEVPDDALETVGAAEMVEVAAL